MLFYRLKEYIIQLKPIIIIIEYNKINASQFNFHMPASKAMK